MARSIWKGSINFMVVTIPAKVYSATEDGRISFHGIHGECGSRVQMPKWCPNCNRKVEAFEIKKGYEVGEGHIILEESDFASIPLRSVKSIEVIKFVEASQIVPIALSDCYFLTCEDMGAKPFTLFLKAMEMANLVAIGKWTHREHEHLSAIRPYDGVMLLHTLHYANELRPCNDLKPRAVTLSDSELELAKTLIDKMKGDFNLADYQDNYRQALEKLIEAKIAGTVIAPVPEAQPATSDVADALIKSLQLVGAGK